MLHRPRNSAAQRQQRRLFTRFQAAHLFTTQQPIFRLPHANKAA
nr:hypothetical protein [uncultured Kingella sp.]